MSAVLEFSSPKKLSIEDFRDIRGSNLHSEMMKNRCILKGHDFAARSSLVASLEDWLEEHSTGVFHIVCEQDNWRIIKIYLESDIDLIALKLFFDGKEIAEICPQLFVAPAQAPQVPSIPQVPNKPKVQAPRMQNQTWEDEYRTLINRLKQQRARSYVKKEEERKRIAQEKLMAAIKAKSP